MKLKRTILLLTGLFVSLLNAKAQDGTLDQSFAPLSGASSVIQRMAVQPDGKIVIIGGFATYDGVTVNGVARVNTDGTLDQSFDSGLGFFLDWGQYGRALALQPDGKILIGGVFTNYDNNYSQKIARINADGSFDPTFVADNVTAFGINGEVDVIKVQPDGKILVGGSFNGSGSFNSKNIIRFLPNGSVDQTFIVGGGPNSQTGASSVSGIAIQPDGKIIVVGNFTKYGTTTVNHIVRLNADGSMDNTFNTGTGCDNSIDAVTLLPDGKIVITGWFHSFNGITRWNIARLNSDGSLDTSFVSNLPAIPNSYINCHAVQQDGKVIVNAGWTRLYDNGSKDTTDWHNGSFAGGGLTDIHMQQDGKILLCGNFVSFDGIVRNRILRLNGTSVLGVQEGYENPSLTVFPNPGSGTFHFRSSGTMREIKLFNLSGEEVFSETFHSSAADIELVQPKGIYFYRVSDNHQHVETGKIVVQ